MSIAVQATTTSAVAVAAAPQNRQCEIQNLGPEAIWVQTDGTAASATTGIRILPGQYRGFTLQAGDEIAIKADTTNQVSPADTRIEVTV